MQSRSSVKKQHDIIVWSKSAVGDVALPVAPIVIPARRYTGPTGRGAASSTGPAIHMFPMEGAIEGQIAHFRTIATPLKLIERISRFCGNRIC